MTEWKPIRTAYPAKGKIKPRGGERILAWYFHYDHNSGHPIEYYRVGIGTWIPGGRSRNGEFVDTGEGSYLCDGPSKILMWMPLPSPPSGSEGKIDDASYKEMSTPRYCYMP